MAWLPVRRILLRRALTPDYSHLVAVTFSSSNLHKLDKMAPDSNGGQSSTCAPLDGEERGLSLFIPEFFCDGDLEAIQPSDRPTSVYQAILSIEADEWLRIARDVFKVDPDRLDPLHVLDRIRTTNTCSNLDSPVHVWIDEEGFYGVDVYDRSMQDW